MRMSTFRRTANGGFWHDPASTMPRGGGANKRPLPESEKSQVRPKRAPQAGASKRIGRIKDVPIRSVIPTASIPTPDYVDFISLVDLVGLLVLLLIPVA